VPLSDAGCQVTGRVVVVALVRGQASVATPMLA